MSCHLEDMTKNAKKKTIFVQLPCSKDGIIIKYLGSAHPHTHHSYMNTLLRLSKCFDILSCQVQQFRTIFRASIAKIVQDN